VCVTANHFGFGHLIKHAVFIGCHISVYNSLGNVRFLREDIQLKLAETHLSLIVISW